jgi:16S rRNA (guanine527-N7)-methyltransferase
MKIDEISEALGFDVSRETYERLSQFHDLLLLWSKTHNLIGPKERDHIWERHILDCLQIWPLVRDAKSLIDIGSGAGLPGLVIACLAAEGDAPECILVEANTKRCAFLRHVSQRLGLPVTVVNDRIENVSRETVDVITARAVADLPKLMEMSARWLENGAKAVFLKGETHKEELTATRRCWNFKLDLTPSKSDSFGAVLSLSEVRTHND